MKKETILKVIGITVLVIFLLALAIGISWSLLSMEKNSNSYSECSEIYPLDSCEVYKCRAEHSNLIPDLKFNWRNYEICKIILNQNMTFNESIKLLETNPYDN